MATLAEASGAKIPTGLDGISFLPTLRGEGKQPQHDFLYWEYQGQVAVRKGNWKAYRAKNSIWKPTRGSKRISHHSIRKYSKK